jgi:hypothetical protein
MGHIKNLNSFQVQLGNQLNFQVQLGRPAENQSSTGSPQEPHWFISVEPIFRSVELVPVRSAVRGQTDHSDSLPHRQTGLSECTNSLQCQYAPDALDPLFLAQPG